MTDIAEFELSVTRLIAAPRERVWQVLIERTEDWWAPKPWRTEIIARDLRPGGRTAMIMHGPDGPTPVMEGVFLEVISGERLVTTDAYRAGWIPQQPFMTAIWQLADEGTGTRYTATARHWTAEAHRQHEGMGFIAGWTIVAGQLAALCEAGA